MTTPKKTVARHGPDTRIRLEDFIDKKSGRLTVLGAGGALKNGVEIWRCRCDCGNELEVIKYQIASGSKESCGCLHRERCAEASRKRVASLNIPQDIKGMVFGRLTVVELDNVTLGVSYWRCSCVCGNVKTVSKHSLLKGHTQSCGCLKRERISQRKLKHGMSGRGSHGPSSRTYRIWLAMRTRCNNPNIPNYHNYGGRGIKVCPEWDDFCTFLRDMGECPPGKSIDRFPDNDGNYEPGNCRWATAFEQRMNQRPRTHCPLGHPYTGHRDYRGRQECRPCRIEHLRRHKQRKLEAKNGSV